MNIAKYVIRKKLIAFVVVAIVLCGGYVSYNSMGRFEDPEYLIRSAVILTPYPGARPDEVAEEITEVIESAVQQLEELEDVDSVSQAGLSRVSLHIDRKHAKTKEDLQEVWNKLRRKVTDAQRRLPPGAIPSIVNDDFGDVFALFLAVTGEGYSYAEIQDYVDMLSRELLLVPGVARIELLGQQNEAIFVEIPRARMAQLGIPPSTIFGMLQQQNINAPSGKVIIGSEFTEISPTGAIDSVEAIGNLLISGRDANQQIFLRDVATIHRGYTEPPRLIARYNGRPAICIGISNISGGNVVEMGDATKARLRELESLRPIGMEINTISYQSDTVRTSINSFVKNLALAVAIVTVTLLVFMGFRSGLIMGAMLILTVSATFIAMFFDGINMQRISLGALIIALGMLVDNAIVVTEGILVRIQRGEDRVQAASKVVRQTMWPLLGGTLVGVFAFSPIGFSQDSTGEYTGSLFWVVCYSLLLSWVFSITLTPLFCVLFLKRKKRDETRDPYDRPFYRLYRRFLEQCLRFRWVTVGAMVLLLWLAVRGFAYVPPGFMPDSPRKQFIVDFTRPYGTSIHEVSADLGKIEQRVLAMDGVEQVSTFVGGGALRYMLIYFPRSASSSYGQLLVDVEDYRLIPDLMKEVQIDLAAKYPDAQVNVWKHVLGPTGGSKIVATFRGPDANILRSISEQVKDIMYADGKAVAVKDNWRERVKVVRPVYSQSQARRAGVSLDDLKRALHTTFTGARVGVYREQDTLIPIIFRPPEDERSTVDNIADVQVWSPVMRSTISINQVVSDFQVEWEDPIVRRENRFPIIRVMCDPAPGVLASTLHARLKTPIENIQLPPGYTIEWDGVIGGSREAQSGIRTTLPYGLAAMLLTVIFLFNALRQPIVIWMATPLAIIGVTVGLLVFQVPFEFMATLGFLSLIGMLVKNGIVLVDQIDIEIREGKAHLKAIVDSSVSRARPVTMGSLTTVLGIAPLTMDPFFKSMAITIMFGLSFATVLTLVVVPVFYAILFRAR